MGRLRERGREKRRERWENRGDEEKGEEREGGDREDPLFHSPE